MLHSIIDRRLAGKNKSIGNRERFLRRYRGQIADAVRRAVSGRGIRDLERGEEVRIPQKDLSEPVFRHGEGGRREVVHTGNREYLTGDRIQRPQGGTGQGRGGQASDSGEGEDDFTFALSREEFMQVFFDDLALPNLVRTQLAQVPEYKTRRAGFTSSGTPNNLHIVRSMRGAYGRRIALGGAVRRQCVELEERAAELRRLGDDPVARSELTELEARLKELRRRIERLPYIDPIDLKFRSHVRVPIPSARAVMFCLMDVSGSMDEQRKDLAKRFFVLLYLFLTRHYDRIDLVFIRHHTQAQEVTEEEFFHARETGGTVVSSALELMDRIVRERYNPQEWNIYGAQASDGDNWQNDSPKCTELLNARLLPACRYYAYIQVTDEEQNLWQAYEALAQAHPNFALRKVSAAADIYPVFRELFRKEGATA
ncbi:YeaH/YhbH family protein [Hydrogenophaga sp. MI9]|uniref:YeaH/YhbH family protein n=1 Tax=Hydrogenophaga sp. MI9 TaxID=3453719 RepID=UPI003EEF3192